jgi:threonine/homoserine/homoserine lactone efflux protein
MLQVLRPNAPSWLWYALFSWHTLVTVCITFLAVKASAEVARYVLTRKGSLTDIMLVAGLAIFFLIPIAVSCWREFIRNCGTMHKKLLSAQ